MDCDENELVMERRHGNKNNVAYFYVQFIHNDMINPYDEQENDVFI